MVPHTVRAVGMSWYYRQDYRRILEIMEDADKLHSSYDQWRKAAELGEKTLKRQGHTVIRAMIDPEEFELWCRSRGLKLDAHARNQFASETAFRQIKETH